MFTELVRPTLILSQSTSADVETTDFGVINDVIYAVLSFLNASFLNPLEFNDI